jgi:hypothetical protein
MSIKFGAKAIEFEKDKAGIAVPSKEKATRGDRHADLGNPGR